jgi:Ser/Thr protein kinase RdoA (MazF antagonist)
MLIKLVSENYDLEVKNMKLIDSHFGTELFAIETNKGKYILKTLPLYMEGAKNEGEIANFLYNNGINVARLLQTNDGKYYIETDKMLFHVQEFIEGETLKLNTAQDWFMEASAHTLGKINTVLKEYDDLNINFGKEFFKESTVKDAKQYYSKQLDEVHDNGNVSLVYEVEERLKHLDRISSFNIDANKLLYSNSHGDFQMGQIIVRNKNTTVIDWTSACKLPICLEVILSFVTEDIGSQNGKIDTNRLKKYIDDYLKYSYLTLTDYDIQMMPYVLYYQQLICHYQPPYQNIPDAYKPICKLINNFTKWLYENIETLSNELSRGS